MCWCVPVIPALRNQKWKQENLVQGQPELLSEKTKGWECSSVIEHLPSMNKALCLILRATTTTKEN
jgi:hypothetical protein